MGLAWLVIVAGPPAASASDWPRFRGPNGEGTSQDKNVPISWSAENNILWRTPIPGKGNSSPITWSDRLFLQTASDDGQERQIVCVDTTSGTIAWTKASPGSIPKDKIHPKNTLASCTAATDGERVYMPFWDGKDLSVSAFDFSGKILWTRGLGAFVSQHGAGHAPIVHDGKVIIANDQDGKSVLVALDAMTGKVAWESPRTPFRACYSTPFLLERPGEPLELVVASTAGISSYDPATGKTVWNFTWAFPGKSLRTVGSPITSHGMIFCGSGDGAGDRHAIAIKVDGKGQLSDNCLVWEEKKMFPYVPTMLIRGEYLFFTNDKGIAACHIAKTGEKVWEQRLGGGDISASPVMIEDRIYAINESGEVFVFAAAPEFKLLAQNSMGEGVRASPAVANSKLFIRGQQHLFCIGQ
jgi:outer membrane protein assembly factor BamB